MCIAHLNALTIRKLKQACFLAIFFALLGHRAILAQTFGIVLNTNLFQPAGIAVSPLNHYLISDTDHHRIVEFNADKRDFSVLAGPESAPFVQGAVDGLGVDSQFRNPQGIIALTDRVIVADTGNHLIRSITYQGVVKTLAGNVALAHEADDALGTPQTAGFTDGAGASASFNGPAGLAYDGNGHVYIADSGNKAIRVINLTDNSVSTVLRTGLLRPVGLAFGRSGLLYIADAGAHSVKSWKPGDSVSTLVAGSGTSLDRGFRNSSVAKTALFSAPSGLYYHDLTDELIVADTGNGVLRVVQNVSSDAPSVATFAKTESAGMQSPVAVTRDAFGVYLVCDPPRNALVSVVTVLAPRIQTPVIGVYKTFQDRDTGILFAINDPVTERVFDNDVSMVISGDPLAQHYFTTLVTDNPLSKDTPPLPSTQSLQARDFPTPQTPPPPLPTQLISANKVVKVKAFSAPRGSDDRIASQVAEATFIFRVATPILDSTAVPGSLVLKDNTEHALIYYTLDGLEPDPAQNANVLGPKKSGDVISLVLSTNTLVVKAKAFRPNYLDSDVAFAEFTRDNYVPNRISLGFQSGEASSKFIGAAGQHFYAPVTLSLIPGVAAYGLQFNLAVHSDAQPATPLQFGFFSTLMEKLPGDIYRVIPPKMFSTLVTNLTTYPFPTSAGTSSIPVLETSSLFTDLLFTNHTDNLLGVGWVERFQEKNLYDTKLQTLVSYSLPHDTLFQSSQGQVVAGAFLFSVPQRATNNETYTLRVDRPSATGDGVASDVFIQVPDERFPDSDIKSYRTLRVGTPGYIVGDVAPFFWYNAGDFGDTNILNNDLTQLQETIVYALNLPPVDSDFMGAFDTCCVSTNAVDLSSGFGYSGDDLNINKIGFGDGRLEVNDVFVAFRRALDPSLVWYYRYWSNGILNATVISNMFRGDAAPLQRQSALFASSLPTEPTIQTPIRPALTVSAGAVTGMPGEKVSIPLRVHVEGGYPLRAFMFNARIQTVQGTALPDSLLSFTPSAALGAPTVSFNQETGHYGAAWLATTIPGVLGDAVIGTIEFTVPAGATPDSLFLVKLERVSGSPNGITLFPIQSGNGLVAMANRPAAPWNDSIPDSWRIQYFGSNTDPRSYPDADPDGDGLSNYQEYKLGTNPLDANDNLRINASSGGNKAVNLRFRTSAGRKYRIEASENLQPGSWTTVQTDVLGTGGDVELPRSGTDAHYYYRVRLQD